MISSIHLEELKWSSMVTSFSMKQFGGPDFGATVWANGSSDPNDVLLFLHPVY